MKKFQIDSSDFESFIKKGYSYVDKTDIIFKLTNDSIGSKFFLSRPRRFGKSLLLSTIKYIFQGRRDLFKGLAIDSLDWNWEETYPVLHINMNECVGNSIEEVKSRVLIMLEKEANSHKVELSHTEDLPACFYWLINDLKEKNNSPQIVLLLDEYDKPLLNHIGKEEVIPYREFLKEFYTVIKDTEAFQRFTLITGVSKFAHVSIFSGLNNLKDLTMNRLASKLLGYTHEEMHDNFKENIKALADANNLNYEQAFEKLIFHYDGYRFSSKDERVFNPVSVANVLTDLEFKNSWFATGTPGWLVPYMKSKPCFLEDKIVKTDVQLQAYDPVNPDVANLLLQTGYLTISGVEEAFRGMTYVLDFPNNEVRDGFSTYLMQAYISDNDAQNVSTQSKLIDAIYLGDVEQMINTLKTFYASIPYDIQDKMGVEQAYQNVLYVLFTFLGLQATAEFRTNKGRIDILIQAPDYIYIIEMKLDKPAKEAIEQIHENKYYEQYQNAEKQIFLIGLSFSSSDRNITDYLVEKFAVSN